MRLIPSLFSGEAGPGAAAPPRCARVMVASQALYAALRHTQASMGRGRSLYKAGGPVPEGAQAKKAAPRRFARLSAIGR